MSKKEKKKKVNLFSKLYQFLKPYKLMFFISQFAMLIGTGCALLIPAITRPLFDGALTSNEPSSFYIPLMWMGILAVGDGVFNYIAGRLLGSISERVTADVRLKLFNKLQQKSLDYHSKHNTGESVSKMTNDINLFQQALTTGLSYIIKMFLSLIIAIIMMITLDPLLSLVFFVTLPIMFVITKFAGNKARHVSRSVQSRLSRITTLLGEGLGGIGIIKAFNLEDKAKHKFAKENDKLLNDSLNLVKIRAKTGFLMGGASMVQLIVMLGVGGWRVFSGNLSAGTLVAFMLYAQGLTSPLTMMSSLYVDVQRSLAAAERILTILEDKTVVKISKRPITPEKNDGLIKFNDVSFSYDDKETILENLTFDAKPDQMTAFVGGSGAGKSTLFKLIPRFYDVTSGEINLDDVNINKMDTKTLREKIAIVPQETYLFAMSIYENIACGRPDATTEEIYDAARMANAHDFIENLPEGYDTIAGERGTRLSGGQRQRIAIARAFLKNPLILLLDEATSALDNNSEKLVQQAIAQLMKGRTTLVIAHRLSTVRHADIIHVVDNGKIASSGSHDELMKESEIYKKLYLDGLQ